MMNTQVVLGAIAVLAVVFVLLAIVFLVHGAWTERRLARTRPRIERGRLILGSILAGDRIDRQDITILDTLSHAQIIDSLVDLGSSILGEEDGRLELVARQTGIWDRAESLVASRFWWRRLAGARLFTLFDTGAELMPHLVADRHPLVRAQLAEWTIRQPSPSSIVALVQLVDDPDGLVAFSARDALIRIGLPAVPALAAALEDPERDDVAALLEVGVAIPDPRFLVPAQRLARDADTRVRVLATSVLGSLGGPEATAALHRLLDDPEPDVRAKAVEGIGQLRHWPAAASISMMLEDSSWDVRRGAGGALVAMGAPGILLLRRALDSRDRFAADMARRMLDLNRLETGRAVG